MTRGEIQAALRLQGVTWILLEDAGIVSPQQTAFTAGDVEHIQTWLKAHDWHPNEWLSRENRR